jgi:hypothetical protein
VLGDKALSIYMLNEILGGEKNKSGVSDIKHLSQIDLGVFGLAESPEMRLALASAKLITHPIQSETLEVLAHDLKREVDDSLIVVARKLVDATTTEEEEFYSVLLSLGIQGAHFIPDNGKEALRATIRLLFPLALTEPLSHEEPERSELHPKRARRDVPIALKLLKYLLDMTHEYNNKYDYPRLLFVQVTAVRRMIERDVVRGYSDHAVTTSYIEHLIADIEKAMRHSNGIGLATKVLSKFLPGESLHIVANYVAQTPELAERLTKLLDKSQKFHISCGDRALIVQEGVTTSPHYPSVEEVEAFISQDVSASENFQTDFSTVVYNILDGMEWQYVAEYPVLCSLLQPLYTYVQDSDERREKITPSAFREIVKQQSWWDDAALETFDQCLPNKETMQGGDCVEAIEGLVRRLDLSNPLAHAFLTDMCSGDDRDAYVQTFAQIGSIDALITQADHIQPEVASFSDIWRETFHSDLPGSDAQALIQTLQVILKDKGHATVADALQFTNASTHPNNTLLSFLFIRRFTMVVIDDGNRHCKPLLYPTCDPSKTLLRFDSAQRAFYGLDVQWEHTADHAAACNIATQLVSVGARINTVLAPALPSAGHLLTQEEVTQFAELLPNDTHLAVPFKLILQTAHAPQGNTVIDLGHCNIDDVATGILQLSNLLYLGGIHPDTQPILSKSILWAEASLLGTGRVTQEVLDRHPGLFTRSHFFGQDDFGHYLNLLLPRVLYFNPTIQLELLIRVINGAALGGFYDRVVPLVDQLNDLIPVLLAGEGIGPSQRGRLISMLVVSEKNKLRCSQFPILINNAQIGLGRLYKTVEDGDCWLDAIGTGRKSKNPELQFNHDAYRRFTATQCQIALNEGHPDRLNLIAAIRNDLQLIILPMINRLPDLSTDTTPSPLKGRPYLERAMRSILTVFRDLPPEIYALHNPSDQRHLALNAWLLSISESDHEVFRVFPTLKPYIHEQFSELTRRTDSGEAVAQLVEEYLPHNLLKNWFRPYLIREMADPEVVLQHDADLAGTPGFDALLRAMSNDVLTSPDLFMNHISNVLAESDHECSSLDNVAGVDAFCEFLFGTADDVIRDFPKYDDVVRTIKHSLLQNRPATYGDAKQYIEAALSRIIPRVYIEQCQMVRLIQIGEVDIVRATDSSFIVYDRNEDAEGLHTPIVKTVGAHYLAIDRSEVE